jgi:hypothetical protein
VQLAAAAAGLAIGCLPLLVAGSPVELGLGLALTGLAIPVILVLGSVLAEAVVHPAVLTQAFVWLNSAKSAKAAGRCSAVVRAARPDPVEELGDLGGQAGRPHPQLGERAGANQPGVRELAGQVLGVTERMDQVDAVPEYEGGSGDGPALFDGRCDRT